MNGVDAIKRVSGTQGITDDLTKTIHARIASTQGKTLAMIAFGERAMDLHKCHPSPTSLLTHKLADIPNKEKYLAPHFCFFYFLFFFLSFLSSAKTQQELTFSHHKSFTRYDTRARKIGG